MEAVTTAEQKQHAEWAAALAQAERKHLIRTFSAQLAIEGQVGDDLIRVRGRYIPGAEDATWAGMREIQWGYAPLLEAPTGTLQGIVREALNTLRYMHLHKEIDRLYSRLFGAQYEVELELVHHIAGDRVTALAKLAGLEEIMLKEMHDADRLQFFAGDVVTMLDN
jgi:hypothetical protein